MMAETETRERTGGFQRNSDLEFFLKEINADLSFSEEKALEKEFTEYPIVFVIGPPRSGTTLLTQWLANSGEFAYPTNLLSRFYGAPVMGAKIQRILTDPKYNFRNEILDFQSEISYASENGKTQGALAPNEFWYFWRRFLPENMEDYSDEELLEAVDTERFRREFLGIADVFEKPLMCKGMICDFHVLFLNQVFDKCIFIHTRRNLENNIRSLHQARERQYGDAGHWYSFKTPNYQELIKLQDIREQIRQQILVTHEYIDAAFEQIPEHKRVDLVYEEFCAEPGRFYEEIAGKLSDQGCQIGAYQGVSHFDAR